MSCTLCYRPVINDSISISSIKLRDILDRKFGYPKKLSFSHIEYLEALSDSNVEGADELIDAIRKYECIEVFLEC